MRVERRAFVRQCDFLRAVVAVFCLTLGAFGADAVDVGVAKVDITGPIVGRGMMGYGQASQVSAGLHMRLWARAFVMRADENTGVALVVADLGMITAAVKQCVIDELGRWRNNVFAHENVLLSATHTHSGPGGYSYSKLLVTTTGGFSPDNFSVICRGVTRAIVNAWTNAVPGEIAVAHGPAQVTVGANRSLPAFLNNPEVAEPHFARETVSPMMTLLRLNDSVGGTLGFFSIYALHGTSFGRHNLLVSSDNKGLAAYLSETTLPRSAERTVIAGFANGAEGDVAPVAVDRNGASDRENNERAGRAQFLSASAMQPQARAMSHPVLQWRHAWVRMAGLPLEREFAGRDGVRLCDAALGISFAAGSEEGPSDVPGFREGIRAGDPLSPLAQAGLAILRRLYNISPNPADVGCHQDKYLLASIGRDALWLPPSLPFQIIRIGSLALLAMPGEVTTVAAERIVAAAAPALRISGVETIALVTLANAYSGYVTTPEEYQTQQYEGGFTVFGPQTLNAYRQTVAHLARSFVDQLPVPSEPQPTLGTVPEDQMAQDFLDEVPTGQIYGAVVRQVDGPYRRGEMVKATFRAAHPGRAADYPPRFVVIERQGMSGEWEVFTDDDDPATEFVWRRDRYRECQRCSTVDVIWRVPHDNAFGTYRIRYFGAAHETSGNRHAFSGVTASFEVAPD